MQVVAAVCYGLAVILAPALIVVSRLSARRREKELRETRSEFERLNEQLIALTVRAEALPEQSVNAAGGSIPAKPASLIHVRTGAVLHQWDYDSYGSIPVIKPEIEGRMTQSSWVDRYSPRDVELSQEAPGRADEHDWTALLRDSTPAHWC